MLMLDQGETDTRQLIVATAARFFREIGYQKTTVADIAKALKMSPANIYRFFNSKKQITEAVTELMTARVRHHMLTLAAEQGSAEQRLRSVLRGTHDTMINLGIAEAKMLEMVNVAMTENWPVIHRHIHEIDAILTDIIKDGLISREFHVLNASIAASCTRAAMARFTHPTLLVHCTDIPQPTLDHQIDFILSALGCTFIAMDAPCLE